MAIILCLVAGLLPALITPGLLFYFDVTPKVLVLLIGASIGSTLAILLTLREGAFFSSAGKLLPAALGLQAAALVLATALSTHPALSFSGTNWRRFGMVSQLGVLAFTLLAAAAIAGRERALLWLMRTASGTGCAIAFYAILQYFGIDPFLPAASYRAGEGVFTIVRPPGTLGHADYLAAYLLFVIFAGLALNRMEKKKVMRFAGLGCSFVSGLAVILTGTRSAWLGLAAGLLFLMLRLRPRLRKTHWYGAAALIILLGGFFFSPAGARLRARIHWIRDDALGGARLLLWRDAARMAGTHWMAGFGPETFGAEFPRYQSIELARQYPDFYHESPHNILLDTFSEQGVLGLAGLLLITGIGFRFAWAIRRDNPAIFLGGALATMFVSLQFSAFTLSSAFFYYLTIAALAAAAHGRANRTAGQWHWASAVACAALVPLFLWFGARLAVAEYNVAAVRRDLSHGNLDAAVASYQSTLQWQPPGASYDLPYSGWMARYSAAARDTLLAAKAGQQAMEAAARGVNYPEERQNAFYYLATLFASENDAGNTGKCLRAAISIAPNWFKPHWTLAQLLFLTGHGEDAKTEASIAVDLDGGKHPEVMQTLANIRAANGR